MLVKNNASTCVICRRALPYSGGKESTEDCSNESSGQTIAVSRPENEITQNGALQVSKQQTNLFCSPSCANVLTYTLCAFVQGFAISRAVCSLTCECGARLNRRQDSVSKRASQLEQYSSKRPRKRKGGGINKEYVQLKPSARLKQRQDSVSKQASQLKKHLSKMPRKINGDGIKEESSSPKSSVFDLLHDQALCSPKIKLDAVKTSDDPDFLEQQSLLLHLECKDVDDKSSSSASFSTDKNPDSSASTNHSETEIPVCKPNPNQVGNTTSNRISCVHKSPSLDADPLVLAGKAPLPNGVLRGTQDGANVKGTKTSSTDKGQLIKQTVSTDKTRQIEEQQGVSKSNNLIGQRRKRKQRSEKAQSPASHQSLACEFCAGTFMNRYSLTAHIRRKHSGEKAVDCDVCGKVQPSAFALSAHKRACHNFQSLCHVCGAEFLGRTSLDKHLAGHAGVKRYFCQVCQAGFVHSTSLNNHRAVHMTARIFQCHICSQMFKVRHLLNKHLLKSHQCGPSLDHRVRALKKMGVDVDKSALVRHTNHQCLLCGQPLQDAGHCPSHPDAPQDVFRCQTCGDGTSNIVLFSQHLRSHQGALTLHTRRSVSVTGRRNLSGGSLIKRQVCAKTFKDSDYLSAHMHQHREARFACDVCHKRFTYKCNLQSHAASHHVQTRLHQCPVCHKRFGDRHGLKKHQLKHAVPQFKCDVCGKALTRRPYLLKHYQKMHPEYQGSKSLSVERT